MVDKVLREGLKLKRKCKLLQQMLADAEQARVTAHTAYERAMQAKDKEFREVISRLDTNHLVELQRTKDSNSNEVEELKLLLQQAKVELNVMSGYSKRIPQMDEEIRRLKSDQSIKLEELHATNHLMEKNELVKRALASEAELARMKAVIGESQGPDSIYATIMRTMDSLKKATDLNGQLEHQIAAKTKEINDYQAHIHKSIMDFDLFKKQSTETVKDQQQKLDKANNEILQQQRQIADLIRCKYDIEASVKKVLGDNDNLRTTLAKIKKESDNSHSPLRAIAALVANSNR